MASLTVRQMELGPLANFVYLLSDENTKEAIVVDPGWDVAAIKKAADELQLRIKGIFLTHNHFDHINGVGDVLRFADAPVYIHQQDAPELNKDLQSSIRQLRGGEKVALGGLTLEFLHTPGHTEGSLCLKVNERLLTGDTLFIRGCGRVDLPSSDPEKMYQSLRRIAGLDSSTIVLPGHNYGPAPSGSLGDECLQNPFLKFALGAPLDEFLRTVSG
ncbi:MAG: MBL fold metallo-hydrolase [Elusimicrobia bacterium]|nr:MBL fold metallo-hydrolase [Elusimicrobiota bacterium]